MSETPLRTSDYASIYEADRNADWFGTLPDLSLWNGVRVWDRDVEGADATEKLLRMFNPQYVKWTWLGSGEELILYIRELRAALKYPMCGPLREGLTDCLELAEEKAVGRLQVLRARRDRGDRYPTWEHADLVAEVEAVCGQGIRRGRSVVFRCCFHEDRHPSLSVNPLKKVWYCHPCGRGGGVVDFRKAIAVAA